MSRDKRTVLEDIQDGHFDVWQEVNTYMMPQYGTSMHWPYCRQADCTGCMPPIRVVPEQLDLSIFRKD